LLAQPQAVLDNLPHDQIDPPACTFARILGTRHLIQAAIACRWYSHRWIVAGAGIDATHAATMGVIATISPDRRRLALTNAATAAAFAAAGLTLGLRSR
jgi:hypothetical protein